MIYFKYLICGLVFLSTMSCRSDAKRSTQSQKMTPQTTENEQLQLGLSVRIIGLSNQQGAKIGQSFQAQVAVFEPCVAQLTGKSEMVLVKAAFNLDKKGLLSNVKVSEYRPENSELKACFLKQIEQLDFGVQPKSSSGDLTLSTFYGDGQNIKMNVERSK